MKKMQVLFAVLGFLWITPLVFSTTYIPSYDRHNIAQMGPYELVTLEDGSGWKVFHKDWGTVLSWYEDEGQIPIEISPCYFSSRFSYYMTNLKNTSYVRVNLVEAPDRDSPYALTIVSLNANNYDGGGVYLSNGTYWHVSALDLNKIRNWYLDDLVILGKSHEWFSSYTHILINIHTNTFVRVQKL